MTYPRVHVRGEQSAGRLGVVESVMPPGSPGPRLHRHDFDEAFYVVEGELTFHLDGELVTVGAGEFAFAARKEGVDPPQWALPDLPPVEMLGPPIGAE